MRRYELILSIALALSLTGCALLSKLAGSQLLSTALDMGIAGASAYFDRHPNQEREQAIAAAYLAVVRAQLDYQRTRSPGHAAALDEAYQVYYSAMDPIMAARPPDGGAAGMGPDGEQLPPLVPFRLPQPEQLADAL